MSTRYNGVQLLDDMSATEIISEGPEGIIRVTIALSLHQYPH